MATITYITEEQLGWLCLTLTTQGPGVPRWLLTQNIEVGTPRPSAPPPPKQKPKLTLVKGGGP